MLNSWLHFTNNKFPISTHIEKTLNQHTFLNPLTKPNFYTNNPYFYCIPPKNITDKFMIIRDICKFLQSGLISSMRFEEKLGHTNLNPERIYLYIMDLICNDSEHIFRDKTSQKCLFKTFCYNN